MSHFFTIEKINKDEFISILNETFEEKLKSIFSEKKPEKLSVKDVSKILSISEMTVYSYIKRGWLKSSKIGRRHIIRRSDLEQVIKEEKSLKYRRDV